MTAKHRRVTKNTHGSRMTAGVLTALAMASSNISITNAAPKVVTQPGTQEQQADPARPAGPTAGGAVYTDSAG